MKIWRQLKQSPMKMETIKIVNHENIEIIETAIH